MFRTVSTLADLTPGRYGINEPRPGPGIERFELILVPGLAFGADGSRLGRGRGFYDRFLATVPTAMAVGVCFEFQCLSEMRLEPHDRKVNEIISG